MSNKERTSIPDGLGLGEFTEEELNNSQQPDPFDIDSLAEETNEKHGAISEDNAFDEDLGYGSTEEPAPEEEEEEEEEIDQEEEEAPEEEEEESETPEEIAAKVEELRSKEESELTDEEAAYLQENAPEPEILYDAKRDFPDEDVTPTVYKNRVKLNEGVSSKINYARTLKNKLEENGSSLGAIRLPEIFEDDEGFIDRPFDRASFSDIGNEEAKKAVFELDRFIKDVGNKIENVQRTAEQRQQVEQVSEEYQQAVTQLGKDIQTFGLNPSEIENMPLNELFSKIEEEIIAFEGEKGEEYHAEHGLASYNSKMRDLIAAKDRIKKFPSLAEKFQKVNEKPASSQSTVVDPETVKSAYRETRQDRADLPIFATKETERAFLEWVENEIYQSREEPADTPRKWVKLASKYQDVVEEELKKYQSDKSLGKKKEDTALKTNRANRDAKKKPDAEEVKTDKKSRGQDVVTVFDIDDEIESLAEETNNLN